MLNGTHALPNPIPTPHAVPLGPEEPPQFIGVSSVLRRLLLQAEITAPRLQVATLEGESGTGKHLFAQTLHRLSAVADLPFRRYDAREWLASEADLAAPSGTIYLDRVDLLLASGQGLLLNFVKALQSAPLGAPTPIDRPAQRLLLLISTHASLRQLAVQGSFLPDLAFRLTAVRFALPPLREHREDIAPIAQALIDRVCRRYQQPTAVLATGSLSRLLQHSWPGNLREMASILESAILESSTGILRPSNLHLDLPIAQLTAQPSATSVLTSPSDESTPSGLSSDEISTADMSLDTIIHRHIQLVLQLNRGNKLRAARQLGISRSTLYRILAGEATLAS